MNIDPHLVKAIFPLAWRSVVEKAEQTYDGGLHQAEMLVAWDNTFSVDENGVLWMEYKQPANPYFWSERKGKWIMEE